MTAPRVLVTGATGLIGRHLAGPLGKRGFEVVALGRSGGDL
ncbi:MAG: NAD-dependent epimerase/dehydratase family protein, partial [Albidovulum sp.]